ncbi:MAG: hypothetical protein LBR09_00970 [Endomicrobium sp.]|jgi:dolichol kinase|nr:hypothetical protein [Endomicrobium sp.]
MVNFPEDEVKRKIFHLFSLIYIFGYWYLSKTTVIYGLVTAMCVVIFFEYLRFKNTRFNDFFKRNFKGFYRSEEAGKMSGLIATLSGALLAILVFHNKYMVFVSFLYFAFGDSAAALVGKAFGRHKIFRGKSLEGSLACLLVCFISGIFIFNWEFALIGAVVATIVEAVPWKIGDNFWMQIINAGFLSFLSGIIAC